MNGTMTPTTNGRWNNRLLEHGFTFTYPHWPDAARDLCGQWHVLNGTDTGSRSSHTVSGEP